MRLFLAAAVALAACRPSSSTPTPGPSAADAAALARDVAWLAADEREGRGTGTAGYDSAAAWAARRFASLGLEPVLPGYLQPYEARPASRAHAGDPRPIPTHNVVGVVRGTDPLLRAEYLVVGAHLDHLGRTAEFGARDPGDAVRNGADDNASGSAAVLELARLVAARPLRRSVLFVLFSGEEMGLLGSAHFVANPPVPLAQVRAMLNFDMVGRLRNDRLIVYGVATARELPAILDSANVEPKLRIAAQGDGFGPSDHASFHAKDLPVLHFFTDLHEDYHTASDDADAVDAPGLARVTDYALRVARLIGDRPAPLTFARAAAPATTSTSRAGSSAYLGSIPDMAAGEVKGVRLSGVRAGSPGDAAGLKAEDVIVEFDGKAIADLHAYTDALRARQPGDTVRIVVLRGGERVTLTATLGRR